MEIKQNRIAATPRSKYHKYLFGGSSGSSSGGSISIDTNNFVKKTGEATQTIEGDIIVNGNIISTGEVSAYGAGSGTGPSPATTLWQLEDVSDSVFNAGNGDTLIKENGEWVSKKYDFYHRGITDTYGNIIESPEEYKLRVPKEYRYIGLEVVLRTNPDDTTYTKYTFKNGIEDYDLEPVDYFIGIESYIEDSFLSTATDKALSANKGRELYNLVININGGTY